MIFKRIVTFKIKVIVKCMISNDYYQISTYLNKNFSRKRKKMFFNLFKEIFLYAIIHLKEFASLKIIID